MDEETRDIWKKLAAKTKSESEDSGELPTAEDLVQGPLPEAPDEIAERQRKLEAARLAEEAKRQEEARRAEELRKAEEEAIRLAEEDARKAEEERIAEELRAVEDVTQEYETEEIRTSDESETERPEEITPKPPEEKVVPPPKTPPQPEPSSVPESDNLLLLGLVNLMQPALDIKLESKRYQRWIRGWDKVIEVNIVDEGKIHVIIKDNKMTAAVGPAPRPPDIVMEGDYETMTNYLNGELDPVLMFFDFVLLRKARLVKGLELKLSNLLSGNIFKQARDLYRIDKILKIS
ncbi:MAG: hypothetical protein ACTSRC_16865 [Candidatus Helarchaeota archaeon]